MASKISLMSSSWEGMDQVTLAASRTSSHDSIPFDILQAQHSMAIPAASNSDPERAPKSLGSTVSLAYSSVCVARDVK